MITYESIRTNEEYCTIFNECYPQFKMSYERFSTLVNTDKCSFYDYEEHGAIIGFAIVEDFAIRMICVKPDRQKTGIGTKLLADVEKDLLQKGYPKVITGGVSSRLFIGADSNSWGFFQKNGYQSVGNCDEMFLRLKDFHINNFTFHGHDIAEYGWFEGDLSEIQNAVASVDEGWVQYFTNPKHIFTARVNGEIASFCLVDTNCQNYLTDAFGKVGMPGCVGSVPKFRNKGIAIEMIAKVTEYLKEQDMDISFIFFTGVAKWYEQVGYQTFLTEVFGEKSLSFSLTT